MAAIDHTRLRAARADARDKSTDNRRDNPRGAPPRTAPTPTRPSLPPLPPDARSFPPTHPLWVLRTAVLPTAPPIAWEYGLPPGHVPNWGPFLDAPDDDEGTDAH